MAPSTPPPPKQVSSAALTMADFSLNAGSNCNTEPLVIVSNVLDVKEKLARVMRGMEVDVTVM